MRILIGTVTALTVWAAAGLAMADQLHMAKGKIVAADPAGVIMVLENGHRHSLELSRATQVYDEFHRLSAVPLQPGDFVEEDCVALPTGNSSPGASHSCARRGASWIRRSSEFVSAPAAAVRASGPAGSALRGTEPIRPWDRRHLSVG